MTSGGFVTVVRNNSFIDFRVYLVTILKALALINQQPKICPTFVAKNWSKLQLGIYEIVSNYSKTKKFNNVSIEIFQMKIDYHALIVFQKLR